MFNAETAWLFHPRITKAVLYLGGLTQALYVAHGLKISESALERHTNKSGVENVFRFTTCQLAVQK